MAWSTQNRACRPAFSGRGAARLPSLEPQQLLQAALGGVVLEPLRRRLQHDARRAGTPCAGDAAGRRTSNSTAISGTPPRCGAMASRTAPPAAWCSKNAALSAARTVDLPSSLSPEITISPSPSPSSTTGPASLRNWAISIRRSLMRLRPEPAMLEIEQAQGQRRHFALRRRRLAASSASSRATAPITGAVGQAEEIALARLGEQLVAHLEVAQLARPARRVPLPAPRVSQGRRRRSSVSWTTARSRPAGSASSRSSAALGSAAPVRSRSSWRQAWRAVGRRRDRRRHARLVQLDQQRVAGLVGAEAVGLGRAGIPGARARSRACRASRPAPDSRAARGRHARVDRVGRVRGLGQAARHRAVGESDPQRTRRACRRRPSRRSDRPTCGARSAAPAARPDDRRPA